ncbi:PLP-dependent aminotransferase family protein [Paludibacterium sp. THUN1379]|nr:PLP-dependent aminotransferase family protein [Paludibacterium sp. THUN1379]
MFLQIAEAIRHDIRAGRLQAGEVLPPQRLLADLLGIHLSTVTRAYGLAEQRGLIVGQGRRGTVVRDRVLASGLFAPQRDLTDERIDLSSNVPAQDLRDRTVEKMLMAMLQEQGAEAWMRYCTASEWLDAQADVADWLGLCGLDTGQFAILLCAGAQHALDQALAMAHGGRDVAVECLTYPGVQALAAMRGLQLHGLAMDAEGVRPDSLDTVAQRGVRVAIVSSNLQNPTGATMGLARRLALVEVARRRGVTLIEEDVYGLLTATRLPPLAMLAPERTLYLTSLSKTVAPGLRLGMLAAPPTLAPRAEDALHLTGWQLSPLMLALGCRLIRTGEASRRLNWQRQELAARHRLLDRALGLANRPVCHCPHRWLPVEGHSTALISRLREAGIWLVDGQDLAVGRAAPEGVRLALGAAVSRRQLERAARQLAVLLPGET